MFLYPDILLNFKRHIVIVVINIEYLHIFLQTASCKVQRENHSYNLILIGTESRNTNEQLEVDKFPFFVCSPIVRYKNNYELVIYSHFEEVLELNLLDCQYNH